MVHIKPVAQHSVAGGDSVAPVRKLVVLVTTVMEAPPQGHALVSPRDSSGPL